MKNIDLEGFSKNELTFSPMKAKDKSIINFEGSNIERNFSVLIFVKAAEPLSKNEGVKGKQYNKNSMFNSFFLILSRVHRYLLLFIFCSNFFAPTFLSSKNKRKEPKQFPIHEYTYPKKNPKTATFIITKPTNGSTGKKASKVGNNMAATGPQVSMYFKKISEYSINSILYTISSFTYKFYHLFIISLSKFCYKDYAIYINGK